MDITFENLAVGIESGIALSLLTAVVGTLAYHLALYRGRRSAGVFAPDWWRDPRRAEGLVGYPLPVRAWRWLGTVGLARLATLIALAWLGVYGLTHFAG